MSGGRQRLTSSRGETESEQEREGDVCISNGCKNSDDSLYRHVVVCTAPVAPVLDIDFAGTRGSGAGISPRSASRPHSGRPGEGSKRQRVEQGCPSCSCESCDEGGQTLGGPVSAPNHDVEGG